MAKKSKKRVSKTAQRDNIYHPKETLLSTRKKVPYKYTKRPKKVWQHVEDLRRWNPERALHLKTVFGTITGYQLSKPKTTLKQRDRTKDRIQFKNPLRTIVCLRRKIRREILFRQRKIGMGVSLKVMRIMSPTSNIKC